MRVRLQDTCCPVYSIFWASGTVKQPPAAMPLQLSGGKDPFFSFFFLISSPLRNFMKYIKNEYLGLPWWRGGWESACQCRRHGFEPWSGKIPHAAEQLGPWATTTEPQLLSLRVWSLCSATREAAMVRGPRTAMKSGPRSPQLEKALAQKRRPNTAKNKHKF